MFKKLKLAALAVIITWTALYLPGVRPAVAEERAAGERGKAIMVIIDRVTWDDLLASDTFVIKQVALKGSVGLMTTNTATGLPRYPVNTYATVGAGSRIGGGSSGGNGFNVPEKYENGTAGEAFSRHTGVKTEKENVVHLGIAQMEKSNAALRREYTIGAIGTIMHHNGLKTAVIGNADIPGELMKEKRYNRQVVSIAMDNLGIVDFGDVSEGTYRYDREKAAGIKTDFNAVLDRFDSLKDKADLIVIETGDMSRAEDMKSIAADDVIYRNRQEALVEIDRFIGTLLDRIDMEHDLLMIVVPTPPGRAMEEGNLLTPFIMAGNGIEPGLAWSGTVKRNGLVTNVDIAASLVEFLGLQGDTEGKDKDILLSGRPVKSIKSPNAFEDITKLQEDTVFLYNSRLPLVKSYINGVLAVMIVSAVLIWAGTVKPRYLVPVFVSVTTVPVIMLWANRLYNPSIWLTAVQIIILMIIMTFASLRFGRGKTMTPFLLITGITGLMIAGDILAGAPLAKTSPLSYDAMTGARFYGIGNEFMGALIGSIIVFAGLFMDRLDTVRLSVKRLIITLLFIIIIYIIAAPNLGTNVGGTIAAAGGLGIIIMIMYGVRLDRKTAVYVIVAIMILLACFMAYDMTRPVETQSHIGRTIKLLQENGFNEAINIIRRKWAVNFKLIKNTTWSWFYFSSLLVIYVLGKRYPHEIKELRERQKWFTGFIPGIFLASALALVFNDSGVVAAAIMMTYAVAPFMAGLIIAREKIIVETRFPE
ncbi:MAG: hypothetical protein CVU89_03495 [Firmicutes bacterium HGW-Firmicutes-14]|nr:MAG: hypothetical protein CVU89_03495 [Firmicutes bacterium HGW-Firmicutes-14]